MEYQKVENDYTILYHDCDKEYIEDLVQHFSLKSKKIMEFFHITSLDKHVLIKIWDVADDYDKLVGKYADWEVGRAIYNERECKIQVLSYNEILKRKGHSNEKISCVRDLILHEFVHICHLQVTHGSKCLRWVGEALATTISGQYDGKNQHINCSLDNLVKGTANYSNFHMMGKFVLENYGSEYFLKLALNKTYAEFVTEKLYEEAEKWSLQFHE